MPVGLRGITSIFDFYLSSIDQKLSQFLNYDVRQGLVKHAVHRLANAMAEAADWSLPLDSARDVVNELLPRSGYEQSLFRHIESEGLIAVVPTFDYDGEDETMQEHVRFTYQRFADHIIVRSLLEKNLDLDEPSKSFQAGTVLHELTEDPSACNRNYGLIEALCVQLPEGIGKELHEVAPYAGKYSSVRSAMIESFIWRSAFSFTDASNEFVRTEILSRRDVDDYISALITLAPTPGHPLNADRLHRILAPLSMADRDSHWAIYLHSQWKQQGSVDRLIDWSWKHSDEYTCDDEVVRLSAIALVWFLTASNRELRDSATKGLIRLIKKRLHLLPHLIDLFLHIDEPYVSERLMAVAFGCAMRSTNDDDLAELAQHIYDKYFIPGSLPVHLITRDDARGVIEIAIQRGCKISIDIQAIRPPYGSDWPTGVEFPTRTEANEFSGFAFYNTITNDFEDFSKYLTDFSEWCPRRLGESRKASRKNLVRRFLKSLTARQMNAWDSLAKAQRALLASDRRKYVWRDTTTKEIEVAERAFILAERKFMRTLGVGRRKRRSM